MKFLFLAFLCNSAAEPCTKPRSKESVSVSCWWEEAGGQEIWPALRQGHIVQPYSDDRSDILHLEAKI